MNGFRMKSLRSLCSPPHGAGRCHVVTVGAASGFGSEGRR